VHNDVDNILVFVDNPPFLWITRRSLRVAGHTSIIWRRRRKLRVERNTLNFSDVDLSGGRAPAIMAGSWTR